MTTLRLSHIGLCVPDLAQATTFYCEVFGFTRVSALDVRGPAAERIMELARVDLRAAYLERDGTRLELLWYRAPQALSQSVRELNRMGLTHLSFRVTDLTRTIARVEAAGGRCLAQTLVEQGSFKSVFVLDPGNTRIELLEAPVALDWLPGESVKGS